MRALGTFLHATSDTATAILHTASIGVAVGAAAAAYTHHLRYGLIVGAATLLFAGAGFGFSLWRTYGPRTRRHILFRRWRAHRPS
jgi:hypothetical protein